METDSGVGPRATKRVDVCELHCLQNCPDGAVRGRYIAQEDRRTQTVATPRGLQDATRKLGPEGTGYVFVFVNVYLSIFLCA